MGFFSYNCKHCDHSILSPASTDPEINEWMKDAVVLTSNGSRFIGEYGGYGNLDSGVDAVDGAIDGDAVWLHRACWEVAGKPEYDRYDGPSDSAADQGYFFGKEHDVIDPRVTDEAERARLLTEGIMAREAREARWYDDCARKVAEWLDPKEREYHDEDKKKEPWRHRFSYFETCVRDGNDEIVKGDDGFGIKDGTHWYIRDEIALDEELKFEGTEDGLQADLARRWARFVESDEVEAYLARYNEVCDEAQRERFEKIKAEGRYEVDYGPAKGDTVKKEGERDWTGSRSLFRVQDRLIYETAATMDGPDNKLGVKTFHGQYPEDRIKEVHASMRESRRLAEEEAQRLNDQWAWDGYPLPEGWER